MVTYRTIYRCVCVCVCVCVWFSLYTHNFSSVSWAGLEATTSQYQWAYPAPRSWFPIPLSNKRNQDSLEKWMVLELGQEIHKQAWDQKVGKCSHIHNAHTMVRAYARARMPTGKSPKAEAGTIWATKVILDYNSKYKINAPEFIQIQIRIK